VPDRSGGRRSEESDPADVEPGLMRAVLRHHAKGVVVITSGAEAPVGFCATSLASLSLTPPLVSFSVGLRTNSWETIRATRYVVAHLLAEGQEDVAHRFARAGAAAVKFGSQTRWHRGDFGLPVLDDVLGWLLLAQIHRLSVGDHALVISRVVAARDLGAGQPLIHHAGGFLPLSTHRCVPDEAAGKHR
jgi:flavin reductase (DIM6/NTAB) family NADH-FMN oxidoreductase RutF